VGKVCCLCLEVDGLRAAGGMGNLKPLRARFRDLVMVWVVLGGGELLCWVRWVWGFEDQFRLYRCGGVMNLNLVELFGAEYKVDELEPTRYTDRLQDR
jgi:hypothetical protein